MIGKADEIHINAELQEVHNWTMQNNLSINIEKTLCITFEKKKCRANTLELKLGQQQLKKTECVKFLGVYIDEHLNFKERI